MGTTSPTFLARIFESTLARYATALAAILVALLVRGALSPFVGDYVPFITLFPAVIFAAWFCGIGPSISLCTHSAFLIHPDPSPLLLSCSRLLSS